VAVLAAVEGGTKAVKPDKSKVDIVKDFLQLIICFIFMVKIPLIFTGSPTELEI
jgi:hypothetical protein